MTSVVIVALLVLLSLVALYFAMRHLLAEAIAREAARLSAQLGAQLDSGRQAVGERMAETGRAVADVREQLGRLAETSRRLEALGEGVADVRQLLQVPRLRGTVGELWLSELLRQTFPPSQYTLQYTFRSGERVDAVVRIGGRLLPVDAKFPLDACQRMLALAAAGDANGAERERRLFRRSLRDRVDEIASKYVRPEEGTLDFALMYIPAESVYYEAVVRDAAAPPSPASDDIMAYAMARRVIPVSPHTFYAYLSAVLHGLKGLRVEERAREILAELGGLEQRFERFWTAYEKVGTHLRNASAQYDESRQAADRVRQQLGQITGGGGGGAEPAVPASAATLPVDGSAGTEALRH